jgi:hypothetical protein
MFNLNESLLHHLTDCDMAPMSPQTSTNLWQRIQTSADWLVAQAL